MGDSVRLMPYKDNGPLPMPAPDAAQRWVAPFEIPAPERLAILLTAKAYLDCCSHAASDLDNEVGGGLVGQWLVDPTTGREHILIEAVIPARFTTFGRAHLTFTQDTLVDMQDELDSSFPGRRLVGWFHTHPKMSIFLSGYDLWLHHHFFPETWQVALVIEPHTHAAGFFKRQEDGVIDPHRYEGFYEVLEDGHSVVTWNNMTLSMEMPDVVEGGRDE